MRDTRGASSGNIRRSATYGEARAPAAAGVLALCTWFVKAAARSRARLPAPALSDLVAQPDCGALQ